MLRLENLLVQQDDFRLMADVRFPDAALTAVVGPSGAGKSTVLSVIAGFYAATRGDVLWQDRPVTGLAPAKRPCAILFQDNNLFPHLTAAQNVALGLGKGTRPTAAVFDALADVGLQGLEDRKPAQLSGGQQSRVALARVMLQDKPVVLLDEPFSALGPAMRTEMIALVRDRLVAKGRTVIMVTHDRSDANAADFVSVVADGRVAQPVETSALLAAPPDELRAYWGK